VAPAGGTRIARPNCSWSHGGFDIGYAVAPITAAGPLGSTTFTPRGHSDVVTTHRLQTGSDRS
jgi:hypothetical protein